MGAIARLKALLGIDNKQYKAGMRASEGATKRFQRTLSSVGRTMAAAFSVGVLVSFTKRLIDFASEIRHTADNLNISTESLQALNVTALKYGITVQDQTKLLGKLRQSQGKVAEGDKEYTDAVELLNIELDKFANAGTDQALEMVARAYVEGEQSAEKYSAVLDLLGRAGKKATAFLVELADKGVSGITKAAIEAGDVISDRLITKLELAGTRMEQLSLKTKVFGADTLEVLAEAVEWWNGYQRAVSKGLESVVGLSRSAKQKVRQGALLDVFDEETGEGGGDGTGDKKELDKLRESLRGLREKFLFNRMDEAERLATLQDRYQQSLQQTGATEKEQLAIVVERFKLFTKIEALQKSIQDKTERRESSIARIREAFGGQIEAGRELGASGIGAQVSAIARVGGQIGTSRAGLGIADRQLKIQMESAAQQRRIAQLNTEMNEAIQEIRDQLTGGGV